jgi:glycosyltransferase involved in cell wall biosynthesis
MFVIPKIIGGGAERIMLQIIKNLDRERFSASLALFEHSERMMEDVPPDVPVTELGESRHYRLGLFRIIRKLFRLIKAGKPDIVFSVINVANFLAIPAARLAGAKVIAYEMSHPYQDIKVEHRFPFISSALLRLTYPFAHIPLALSRGIGDSLIKDFGIRAEKVEVSYTPFNIPPIRERAAEEVQHPFLDGKAPVVVGIGALYKNKGFDFLVRAMALVNEHRDARLILVGEGTLKEAIERLALECGISGKVSLVGFQGNPWKFLSRASVFALPSLHEGFGNVIVEAMICGVPVVSTDCPVGPKEILEGGKSGLLVPAGDHTALAKAISRLLEDDDLRADLARKGKERAMDFDAARVMRKLERLMEALVFPTAE